jgi:hypothetical protein
MTDRMYSRHFVAPGVRDDFYVTVTVTRVIRDPSKQFDVPVEDAIDLPITIIQSVNSSGVESTKIKLNHQPHHQTKPLCEKVSPKQQPKPTKKQQPKPYDINDPTTHEEHTLTEEQQVELCREFYEEFHRVPKPKDVYKNEPIGQYVLAARRGKSKLNLDESLNTSFANKQCKYGSADESVNCTAEDVKTPPNPTQETI